MADKSSNDDSSSTSSSSNTSEEEFTGASASTDNLQFDKKDEEVRLYLLGIIIGISRPTCLSFQMKNVNYYFLKENNHLIY